MHVETKVEEPVSNFKLTLEIALPPLFTGKALGAVMTR
jgi:hypothetical protein